VSSSTVDYREWDKGGGGGGGGWGVGGGVGSGGGVGGIGGGVGRGGHAFASASKPLTAQRGRRTDSVKTIPPKTTLRSSNFRAR